jgi:hypothetical protein
MNMVLPKDKRKELKKIVIIFDDILWYDLSSLSPSISRIRWSQS